MNRFSFKNLYKPLLRFQFFLLCITILPLVSIKLFFQYSPMSFSAFIHPLIHISIAVFLVIGCIYILANYSSMNAKLKPIAKMVEVGEMAARVAHDLRGPLSGIRAAQDFFYRLQLSDKDLTNGLNLLDLSAKRLENVADDLLKKNKGQEEADILFSLHEILDELIGEYSNQPNLQGVRFQKIYSRQAISLEGRQNKIGRMFGNLIKNALEAMHLEGVITVETCVMDEAVRVNIKDNGPGISPEDTAKLMSAGFTRGKKDGNGIGLIFVREVLAEHGGKLQINSEIGKGSCFITELPLAKKPSDSFVIEVFAAKPVIVIDDDLAMLEQWRIKLNELGQDVYLYDSFEELKEIPLPLDPSQTVIVDFHFENSEKNGIEIIAELKKQGFTNLYLCTAEYWKPSLKRLAGELGVKICPKPLPKLTLRQAQGERVDSVHGELVEPHKGYTVLVIDDDPVIKMSWELMSQKLSVSTLHYFSGLESLRLSNVDLSSIDIAFVDKNIENSQFSGSDVLAYLKSKSVRKVVLASGESAKTLRTDPQFALADFVVQNKIPNSLKEFFPG